MSAINHQQMENLSICSNGANEKVRHQSISSEYDSGEQRERDLRIHEWLSYEQIEEIKAYIENCPGKVLSHDELFNLFGQLGITLSRTEFETLYLKVHQTRDDKISWSEMCDFIIYLFQQDDPFSQKEPLSLPISSEPVVKASQHTTAIVGISILESPSGENTEQDGKGTYITASKDGRINFWSDEFEVNKKGLSPSYYLKITRTWVLAIVALSDVRIVCVSATERELRFYDVTATNFSLRLVMRHVPFAVCCMHYSYWPNGENDSRLVMGDMGGCVRVLRYSPQMRGPFQSKAGAPVIELTWTEAVKGRLPLLKVSEFESVYAECIQQVYYSQRFDTYYIAAEVHGGGFSLRCGGITAIDNRGAKMQFNVPQGVTAFAVDDKTRILATGGPDALLRLWDALLPDKASAILSGHHAGIRYIFVQQDEKKIYTIDMLRVIKVWHLTEQNLIQTFSDISLLLGAETHLAYAYNRNERELLVGGRKLLALKCCPKIKLNLTDGNTHTGSVSVVLYNKLFKNIVTCGFDSFIIVWDPWTGKRNLILKKCHTVRQFGDSVAVPITAACFGCPIQHFLLTGARNGSLKIWNYNVGVCVRNLSIEPDCEVTAVFWVPDRILVCGWNHIVTEFSDIKGEEFMPDAKRWMQLHDEDITAAAYKPGELLVSGTYSGEIILWRLATGQPYRKFLVERPTAFVKLTLGSGTMSPRISTEESLQPKRTIRASRLMRKSISSKVIERFRDANKNDDQNESLIDASQRLSEYQPQTTVSNESLESSLASEQSYSNFMLPSISTSHRLPMIEQNWLTFGRQPSKIQRRLTGPPTNRLADADEDDVVQLRPSVQAILILWTRPQSQQHGSVFVAIESGAIQVYSSHQLGGYMGEFNTAHKTGDCVICMTTDKKNRFLFAGTAFGYIKVWHIQNYCIPESERVPVCMPLLRLQFIFLRKDRWPGRAKRIARLQPEPILLNSYKAHLRSITTIEYIHRVKILITGSHDSSCRLWTLGGRYLGTLGGLVAWRIGISPTKRIDEEAEFRIPPDIHKVASSTTLKVLTGKYVDRIAPYVQRRRVSDDNDMENVRRVAPTESQRRSLFQNFGKPLGEPLLGKHFKLETAGRTQPMPVLDSTLPHIPVWEHLEIVDAVTIERPPTPEVLRKTKNLQFMDYYNEDRKNE